MIYRRELDATDEVLVSKPKSGNGSYRDPAERDAGKNMDESEKNTAPNAVYPASCPETENIFLGPSAIGNIDHQ